MSPIYLKYLSVFLMSSVKLLMGAIPMCYVYGFSFTETVIFVSTGGIAGSIVFIYLSEWVMPFINNLLSKIIKTDKTFTPNRRRMIRVKMKYGLPGIVILTPSLFSIPLGCLLAVKFYKKKFKIMLYMSISVVIWSFALGAIIQII